MLWGCWWCLMRAFDKGRRWKGFGNVLNFDQDTRKMVWHSSWFHSTSHCVVEQRWSVHTFKLKLTALLSQVMHSVNSTPHLTTCATELKPLQRIYSTFLQQLQLGKTFVVSQNEIPYLAWDMHTWTLNMGVTYEPKDARFQYAHSFQNWQQTF